MNVSSIDGRITYPLISLYHATRCPVEGFSESLAYALGELGIQVKLIEPGGVATDFGGRSMDIAVPASPDEYAGDYNEMLVKFQAARSAPQKGGSTTEQVAEWIFAAATDGKNQLRYVLGQDANQIDAMREQVGDDAFIAGRRQQMLGWAKMEFFGENFPKWGVANRRVIRGNLSHSPCLFHPGCKPPSHESKC